MRKNLLISDRIQSFCHAHDVPISIGKARSLATELEGLNDEEVKSEIKQLIINFKLHGVFSFIPESVPSPVTKLSFSEEVAKCNEIRHQQSILKPLSQMDQAEKQILKKLEQAGMECTTFRLGQYVKSSLNDSNEELNLAIIRHKEEVKRRQMSINKSTPLAARNGSNSFYSHNEYYEDDTSVCYSEDGEVEKYGDDRDSFDYSDDLGDEPTY